jgi:hypothetical protein
MTKGNRSMSYKLWIGEDNKGVLKHIENLGGAWSLVSPNIYAVYGVPAHQIRDLRGVFVMNKPRTIIEAAYLNAVEVKYGR